MALMASCLVSGVWRRMAAMEEKRGMRIAGIEGNQKNQRDHTQRTKETKGTRGTSQKGLRKMPGGPSNGLAVGVAPYCAVPVLAPHKERQYSVQRDSPEGQSLYVEQ